jgi:hypothetical protein
VPGLFGFDGLSAPVVVGETELRLDLAPGATGERRAVLALQDERVGRLLFETLGVEMTPARDAVDVLPVVGMVVTPRILFLPLAFRESLFSLSHASLSLCV